MSRLVAITNVHPLLRKINAEANFRRSIQPAPRGIERAEGTRSCAADGLHLLIRGLTSWLLSLEIDRIPHGNRQLV